MSIGGSGTPYLMKTNPIIDFIYLKFNTLFVHRITYNVFLYRIFILNIVVQFIQHILVVSGTDR